jgi:hypothetical protein
METKANVEGENRRGGGAVIFMFWRGARPLEPFDVGGPPLELPPGGRPLDAADGGRPLGCACAGGRFAGDALRA